MSNTYPQYSLTSFPDQVDSFSRLRNIVASELSLVNQYHDHINNGDFASAQQILANNPTLLETQINANVINKILDAIMAIEKHYADDIVTYLSGIMDTTTEGAIRNDIGTLSNLTTAAKQSLVLALNELVTSLATHAGNVDVHKTIVVSSTLDNADGRPDGAILFYTGT